MPAMDSAARQPRRIVSADALRHNLALLRKSARRAPQLWPAVKAEAYGHGALGTMRALAAGPDALRPEGLCLAREEEALQLREAGWRGHLLVMSPLPGEPVPESVEAGIELTVCAREHIAAAARLEAAGPRPVRLHLKVDTGMGRIGCRHEEIPTLLEAIRDAPGLRLAGIMSHLARADELDSEEARETTRDQIQRFEEARLLVRRLLADGEDRWRESLVDGRPPLYHLANSAATLRWPDTHHDLLRPGLALYGLLPHPSLSAAGLRPALTLRAPVWGKAPGGMLRLGLGAAHGYSSAHAGRSRVLIGGRACPVVEVRAFETFVRAEGDLATRTDDALRALDAVFIGRDGDDSISAEELADDIGTINYEITTGLSADLPVEYSG